MSILKWYIFTHNSNAPISQMFMFDDMIYDYAKAWFTLMEKIIIWFCYVANKKYFAVTENIYTCYTNSFKSDIQA